MTDSSSEVPQESNNARRALTENEVAEIATRHMQASIRGSLPISRIVRGVDMLRRGWRPPCLYGFDYAWEDCWVVYLDSGGGALRSSTILIVRAATAEVVYYGSANDEG